MPKTRSKLRFLITGGSGFLGYHIIKRLLKENYDITILDREELPEKKLQKKLLFIKGDVRNSKDVKKALENVDIVIHAAASLPLESPDSIKTTTINGTENILKHALKQKVKRVIYISSTAVYGIPEKHPIVETDKLHGVGAYGIAKIEAEKICLKYRKKGLVIPIIRPKTFIGTERLGVFQILFNWVRLGKKIPIIGSGNNRYQLLEVEDLVDAILLAALASKSKANDTFNVGAENFSTVREDVGGLCEHAGNGASILPVPAWLAKGSLRILEAVNLSPLYRWVYGTADKDSFVSVEKIKKQLGWKATRSNLQTLTNAYDWYLKHYQEVETHTGTTHRVGWNQGALNIIKKFL